jgi:hypothetical protein
MTNMVGIVVIQTKLNGMDARLERIEAKLDRDHNTKTQNSFSARTP